MTKYEPTILGITVSLHALVHLIGFYAYWPIGELVELPYKTTLLGGAWSVGPLGMTLFGALWLVAALVLLLAAYGIVKHLGWWRPVLVSGAVLSLVLTALDWSLAYPGTILSVGIILFVLMTRSAPRSDADATALPPRGM